MLLPIFVNICDRCYSHIGLLLLTNNDTYWWHDVKLLCFGLDVIDHILCGSGWITLQVLRLFLMVEFNYFSCISGDLTSTSSQMCGSWYLPIFLFRDGSLTVISISSLINLVILWSPLPTMLKLSRDTS